MGHNIPVFFFSLPKDAAPRGLTDWTDAKQLIADRVENGSCFQTTSRNWWHQGLLLDLARHFSLGGLEFLERPATCLCDAELIDAGRAMEALVSVLEKEDLLGFSSDNADLFADHSWREAFAKAEPVDRSSADVDVGFDASLAFFQWVRSLAKLIRVAAANQECVVVVQPQP